MPLGPAQAKMKHINIVLKINIERQSAFWHIMALWHNTAWLLKTTITCLCFQLNRSRSNCVEFSAYRSLPVSNLAEHTSIKVYEYYEPGKNTSLCVLFLLGSSGYDGHGRIEKVKLTLKFRFFLNSHRSNQFIVIILSGFVKPDLYFTLRFVYLLLQVYLACKRH